MSERKPFQIEWRRIVVESAAVVLSILLAFLIDASWDAHQQRIREQELLEGLLADFEASRPGLEDRLQLARRMAEGNGHFLDLVEGETLPTTLTIPDTLVFSVLGGPTFEPATNTLDAALASGEIEIIRSRELRAELAEWNRILADTGEDEREARRITNEQVVPLLATVVNIRPYFAMVLSWSGGDPYAAGRLIPDSPTGLTGETPLLVSSELVGALALRKFFVDFSAADLEELDGSLGRLVSLLRQELGR
jgi:hypothetical protein